MIRGVQDVYVNVENIQRAIACYTDILGCTVQYADEYWASLEKYGLKIGLHWTGGDPLPAIPHEDHGAHVGATITFRSDDIAGDKQILLDNQVTIISEIDKHLRHLLVFKDSEGNILKLMKPKY